EAAHDPCRTILVHERWQGLVVPGMAVQDLLQMGPRGLAPASGTAAEDPLVEIQDLREIGLDQWAHATPIRHRHPLGASGVPPAPCPHATQPCPERHV